jgi:hypothetical protein
MLEHVEALDDHDVWAPQDDPLVRDDVVAGVAVDRAGDLVQARLELGGES